jgi:hypothetical protein
MIGFSASLASCSPAIQPGDAKANPSSDALQSAMGDSESSPSGDLQPKYVCEAPDHDFGDVWVGVMPLTHSFKIRNEGLGELKILKLKAGCGCTQAGEFNRNLAPGESTVIPISLDASRLRTKFYKKITLTMNDPNQPTAELSLAGLPRRYIELDPPTITFGQSKIESRLIKRMTITNQTDMPMALELIEDLEAWGKFLPRLVEKEPGRVFELIVEGVPPYAWNVNRGDFRITTNIPQQPELKPYATVDVPPRIRVTPPKLDFRKASTEPMTRRVMFSNNGDSDVAVLSATTDDELITCNLQKRNDGKEYQINLTFPARYLPPEDGRTLTIRTDDEEFPEIQIPLARWVKPKTPSEKADKKTAGQIADEILDGSTLSQ